MTPRTETPQEKPIDLFKAIFEDDSDNDDESDNQQEDTDQRAKSPSSARESLRDLEAPILPQSEAKEAEVELPSRIVFRPQVCMPCLHTFESIRAYRVAVI